MSEFSFIDDDVQEAEELEFTFGEEGSNSADGETQEKQELVNSQPKADEKKKVVKKSSPRVLGVPKKKPSAKASKFAKPKTDEKSSPKHKQSPPPKQQQKTQIPQSLTKEKSEDKLVNSEAESQKGAEQTEGKNLETPIEDKSQTIPEQQVSQLVSVAPIQNINQELDDKLEQKYESYANEYQQIVQKVEGQFVERLEIESKIKDAEKGIADAASKDKFEEAEAIEKQICALKAKHIESSSQTAKLVHEALLLAKNLPIHFSEHSKCAGESYSLLLTKNSSLEKKLESERFQKASNEQSIASERQKNLKLIAKLQEPITVHESTINDLQKKYDSNVSIASLPFDNKISELKTEKENVNNKIENLLNEIERIKKQVEGLRSTDKEIQAQIDHEIQKKEQAIHSFDQKFNIITAERSALAKEKDVFKQKVQKIESPFQNLILDVEKRTTEIKNLENQISFTQKQMSTNKHDMEEIEDTLRISNSMIEDSLFYETERQLLVSDIEKNRTILQKSKDRLVKSNSELYHLKSDLETSEEMIAGAKAKVDQIEAQKKAYVTAKNFKAAKICTCQLLDFKSLSDRADETIKVCASGISSHQDEIEQLQKTITSSEQILQNTSTKLSKLDFDFFEQIQNHLHSLFKVSPFGKKLLVNFGKLFKVLIKNSPKPVQLTKEEMQAQIDALNAQIEEACSIEDYETADTMQQKVDELMAKLESQ